MYDPAVTGTVSILEAAKKYGPNITRIVITSSCAAVFDAYKGTYPGFVYSEAIWNPVRFPYTSPPHVLTNRLQITQEKTLAGNKSDAYSGAKTWAEKSAWRFVQDNKNIKFTLTTLCPPFVS